jgi:F-type H+-transporting ATPase subunit alpha
VEILKQGENQPVRVENQIAIIYAGTNGLLMSVPVEEIKAFEAEFVDYLNNKHADTMQALSAGKIDDDIKAVLEGAITELTARYKK